MTKEFRILETLDEWGERIWMLQETTKFRPWWRKVQSYYNKDKAIEAMRILTNPEKHETKEKSIVSTWVGLTDKERAQFVIGGHSSESLKLSKIN